MRWLAARASLVACLLASAGCIDTDAAVFVEASVEHASLQVDGSALVAGLSGNAAVHLHLGPRASGEAEVDIVAFSVHRGTTTLVPALGFVASPESPVAVPVDGDVPVTIAFAAEDNQLEPSLRDQLCAGEIVLRGVLRDSLRDGNVTADSESFAPSGCP